MSVKNKETKIHRKTADRIVNEVIERAKEYNRNYLNPLYIKRMVIFGSYVNSDKEMLSDVDFAFEWGYRIPLKELEEIYDVEAVKFMHHKYLDMFDVPTYVRYRAVKYLRNRSAYIHIDALDGTAEERMIMESKHIEVDVDVDADEDVEYLEAH